jgi:hypothetical protein
MKIFGYEPAAWAGALQGVLGVLVVFNVFNLTADQSTLIQAASAAVFAAVAAFLTKKVNLAVVVGALQGILALLVGFGVSGLSDSTTAAVIAAVQLGLAGFLRQNTEPAETPGFRSEPLNSEPLEPDYHPEVAVPAPAPVQVLVPAESATGHDEDGMPEEEPYVGA